jgi:hypothetical protein
MGAGMVRFRGVFGLRGGFAAPITLIDRVEGEQQRLLKARRVQAERLSVVSVVSALQSELRNRRRDSPPKT